MLEIPFFWIDFLRSKISIQNSIGIFRKKKWTNSMGRSIAVWNCVPALELNEAKK